MKGKFMNPQDNKTKLVAKEPEGKTHMTAEAGTKVKIKTLLPIEIGNKAYQAGEELEVSEADAKEFCDRIFTGSYAFSGEREGRGSEERNTTRRAVRL